MKQISQVEVDQVAGGDTEMPPSTPIITIPTPTPNNPDPTITRHGGV